MSEAYSVDTENIMHETIDGEVVIVNLDTGAYYSFDGVGEFIWDELSKQAWSLEDMISLVASSYEGEKEEIAGCVGKFFADLRGEKLITADENAVPAAAADAAGTGKTGSFTTPELQKYTDMETLLLADPIHEVESDGWPNLT